MTATETRGSWQTAYLDEPVSIEPGHVYVVSRNTRRGGTPETLGHFGAANGVYAQREGALPTIDAAGANYWVDVLMK